MSIDFLLVATIILGILGVMWHRRDWLNFIIKIILLGVAVWGIILINNVV